MQHMLQSENRGKKLPLEDGDAKDVAVAATTTETTAMREGDTDGERKSGAEGAWRTRASTQERTRVTRGMERAAAP